MSNALHTVWWELSREKILTNFTDWEPPTKVFSTKFWHAPSTYVPFCKVFSAKCSLPTDSWTFSCFCYTTICRGFLAAESYYESRGEGFEETTKLYFHTHVDCDVPLSCRHHQACCEVLPQGAWGDGVSIWEYQVISSRQGCEQSTLNPMLLNNMPRLQTTLSQTLIFILIMFLAHSRLSFLVA